MLIHKSKAVNVKKTLLKGKVKGTLFLFFRFIAADMTNKRIELGCHRRSLEVIFPFEGLPQAVHLKRYGKQKLERF